ncbi:MAG: cytochrome c biogenesis protein CcdA, partial [Polyangia bacterium]
MDSSNLLAHGYFLAFVTMFVGGFLTSLTPCVYPLIPITVSLFGARGEDVPRSRAMTLAACYVGGIGVMYASLGVGFALAGKAFGTFMANPWIIVPIALLFLAMAASMFGAFELNLPPALAQRLSSVGGKGFGGAFAMGL